jgi:hypothetical protein
MISEIGQIPKSRLISHNAILKHEFAESGDINLLIKNFYWVLAGIAIFFGLYALLSPGEDTLGTFLAAFFSGAIGVFFSSFWLRRYHWGKIAQTVIVLAYIARVLVGVDSYLSIDPKYFQGDGSYPSNNWEYYQTYQSATKAADRLLQHGEWWPSQPFEISQDKNANIHTWMGYFLAAGKSRNALDLAPFNSFHHVVAGIIIIGLAITLGYSLGACLLAGIATAWIPWAFPASIMWRDSIGICWLVAAIALVVIGRKFGPIGRCALAIPAAFLASSVREVYILVVIASALYMYVRDTRGISSISSRTKLATFILPIIIVTGLIFFMPSILSYAFERHETFLAGLGTRLASIPLLILRGIAGPFPWTEWSGNIELTSFYDYAFHVCQLAAFLVLARNWRSVIQKVDVLLFSAVLLWVMGIIASGVHTAYLAVAMPFYLPAVFSTKDRLGVKLIISLAIFVGANAFFMLSGLHGSGLITNTTGN